MTRKKIKNPRDLYRDLMTGITLQDVQLPSMIKDPEEYRKFCKYCNNVYTSPEFKLIESQLMLAQISKTAIDSTDAEQLNFGRAVLNGLALVSELFKKYSQEFEENFTGQHADFDEGKSFESVTNN